MGKTWVSIPDVLFFQEGPGVRNTQYRTKGVKLLNVANLVNGKIDLSTSDRYISEEEAYGKYKHFLCDVGDFIIASSGIKVEYIDRKMGFVDETMLPLCMNTSTIRFKVLDEKRLRIRYFMYYLKSRHFKNQLFKQITGSAQLNYGPSHLKKMIMPLISLDKQDEIIACLDKVQGIIDMRQQELIHLDDLIKARFVEMFGDAVDNPMEWEKKQLQEIVTDDCTISYGIVQTGDDQDEGVPVFRPVDIVNRVPRLDELKKTTEEISNKYRKTILKGREMLITVRANIADTCIVGEEFKGCNVGRGIVPIRTQEDIIMLEFLRYLMDSKHLNDDIKSKVKGITLIQLNMEDLREVELIIPPIEQQKDFVKFANQVDKSKVAVQKALDETQMLFDSLMQKYFA